MMKPAPPRPALNLNRFCGKTMKTVTIVFKNLTLFFFFSYYSMNRN